MTKTELADIVDFANAAAGLTTEKKGAIPAMPTLEEIELCRNRVPKRRIELDSTENARI